MVENEIQFLSWDKFKQMAPSIIQLEISRTEKLTLSMQENTERYNLLIKARFELTKFVARLGQVDRESLEEECAPHLRRAILALSMCGSEAEGEAADTLSYIGDRLNYVHDRMVLLY